MNFIEALFVLVTYPWSPAKVANHVVPADDIRALSAAVEELRERAETNPNRNSVVERFERRIQKAQGLLPDADGQDGLWTNAELEVLIGDEGHRARGLQATDEEKAKKKANAEHFGKGAGGVILISIFFFCACCNNCCRCPTYDQAFNFCCSCCTNPAGDCDCHTCRDWHFCFWMSSDHELAQELEDDMRREAPHSSDEGGSLLEDGAGDPNLPEGSHLTLDSLQLVRIVNPEHRDPAIQLGLDRPKESEWIENEGSWALRLPAGHGEASQQSGQIVLSEELTATSEDEKETSRDQETGLTGIDIQVEQETSELLPPQTD